MFLRALGAFVVQITPNNKAVANIFNIFRKKKEFKSYEFQVVQFNLSKDGPVQYAQWLHPGEFGNEVKQETVNFYRRYVKEGDFVIDIGANEGDTTVPMAIAAGKQGLTLALEPNPHVFKVLTKNASLNEAITNIKAFNFAATAADGEFTFGSGDPSYGNGGIVGFTHNQARNTRYSFQVSGKNLEQYLKLDFPEYLGNLSLIKIDTEGYDKEIIKTIPGIITQYRPVIITECFGPSTKKEKQELFQLLVNHRYELFQLHDFLDSAPEKITINNMSGKKTFDILALPM